MSKMPFLGTFWKSLDEKIALCGARSPPIVVYIGAEGAHTKTLGLVDRNWMS